MPIYKDEKRGMYYVKLSYTDKFKERKYHTKRGFDKRRDAVRYQDEFLANLEDGRPTGTLPFSYVAGEYIAWYSERRKPSSIKTIKNRINNHLLPFFGDVDAHQLTPSDVVAFQEEMQKKEVKGRNLARSYIQGVHITLVSLLNHAIRFHDLKVNAAAIAGNVENDAVAEWSYWTLQEFERFYSEIDSVKWRAYFRLLFFSGMRHGEQRALTWKDIDFEEMAVTVNKTNYNGKVHAPKTKTSNRRIYLPQHVMDDLQAYKAEYQEALPYKDEYVVFGQFHQSIGETTVHKEYRRILEHTELKQIKIHEFRHSHASDCINRLNMNPQTLAARLGHSSSVMIEEVYGHLYPSTQKQAINTL